MDGNVDVVTFANLFLFLPSRRTKYDAHIVGVRPKQIMSIYVKCYANFKFIYEKLLFKFKDKNVDKHFDTI